MTPARRLASVFALLCLLTSTGWAQFGGAAKVPVSLVSEATVVEAGKPFTLAVKLDHPEGVALLGNGLCPAGS